MRPLPYAVALLLVVLIWPQTADAQNYYQNPRAFVRSSQVIGAGDATVAFPTRETVFFYNPAHLIEATGLRPRVTIIGVQGALSTTIFDQVDFYNERLDPAIERGFDNIPNSELQELYDDALAVGRRRAFLGGDVLLPSVMFRTGPLALGAGIFGHSSGTYRFADGGSGVPEVDLAGRVDAMGVFSGALDATVLGFEGLSLGITAKYNRRYVTVKNRPLDLIDEDEPLLVFVGDAVSIDYGMQYTLDLPLPGSLSLGLALYDIASSDYEFTLDEVLTGAEPTDPATDSRVQNEWADINERYQPRTSYRFGAAYTVPSLLGIFGESGVMIDYVGYQDPVIEQRTLAGLHLGAQVELLRLLSVRTGLSQGYPSIGAGLGLGPVKIDYAFFGQEEGRIPGQTPGWQHLLNVRLTL